MNIKFGLVLYYLCYLFTNVTSMKIYDNNDDNNNDNDKNDDSDDEHKDFEGEKFEFENFEIENDKVKIESSSELSEIEYQIECSENDPISFKMEYKSINLTTSAESETKSRVLIYGIQEWYDSNGDKIMQDDEKINDLYLVGSQGYENILYAGPDNSNIYSFYINEKITNDNIGGFVNTISYITNNFTNYYSPNMLKFDVLINNWIFENPQNQLSVLIEYRTESETESEDSKDSESGYLVQTTTDPSTGFSAFEWTTTYIYNGTNCIDYNCLGNIQTRILTQTELTLLVYTDDEYEGEHSTGIWFCFDAQGPINIYWDPNVGVYTSPLGSFTTSSSSKSSKSFSTGKYAGIAIGSIFGFGLVFGIGIFAFKFKRNKEISSEKDIEKLTSL